MRTSMRLGQVLALLLIASCATAPPTKYGWGGGGTSSGGGLSTVTTSAPASGDGSVGSPVTVRAATGSLSGYLSAADKTKLDGLSTVTPPYNLALWAFCKSLQGTLTQNLFQDFLVGSADDYTPFTTGVGAASGPTTTLGNGGVILLQSGTNASAGSAFVFNAQGSSNNLPVIASAKTGGPWCVGSRLQYSAHLDAVADAQFGVIATTLGNAVASFGMVGSVSTTLFTTSVGTVKTVTSTAIPTGSFVTQVIWYDGTFVKFYVGDPVAGTMTLIANRSDITTMANVPSMVYAASQQGGSAGNTTMGIDNFFAAW